MNTLTNLRGSIVAIVTPFVADESVDFGALERLVDFHLANHTDGIVVCGTTGETPTLSESEYREMMRCVVERVHHTIPVIAGAGSNSTARTIENCAVAQACGVDGLLVVGPYYNKPTADGLLQHFGVVARSTELPIIVYNVPGRTGRNIPVATLLELAQTNPNIIGVKDASGDMGQIMAILQGRPEGFKVFSGDDALAMPIVALGGDGGISVVANEIPAEFAQMMHLGLEEKFEAARELHYRYLNLMNVNFVESNPIPVKTALGLMGFLEPVFRLPMCPMQAENFEKLRGELVRLGLVQGVNHE